MVRERQRWTHNLTTYHWFVFLVASAAWFFDCLDQRLFTLARIPALTSLMPADTPIGEVQATGKEVTAVFLVGWGIGGLIFGAFGDRYGRARMLTITVLIYSIFTGLTYFSRTYWDFALCRFLTGLGVGGVFGLAVSLIAETLPDSSRTGALGMLQVLSTIGNIAAGLINTYIGSLQARDLIRPSGEGWRYMFLIGAVPALLVIATGTYLREPDRWLQAKAEGRLPQGNIFGPYVGLLTDRRWRRNLIIGALLASTGVVGLWAIGEYAPDLQRKVFETYYTESSPSPLSPAELKSKVTNAISISYILNMLGAGVGMWIFTKLAQWYGRRPAFAIGYVAALITTLLVYWKMNSPTDAYWMMPLMGAAQLSVFAGFAIYLPELFPSQFRSTGTSFCYNLGRFAAAAGSLFSAKLATGVYGHFGSPLMERYSAMTMCAIFLIGLLTLPFAPETKDQPLPE
jgi:MFS family permease